MQMNCTKKGKRMNTISDDKKRELVSAISMACRLCNAGSGVESAIIEAIEKATMVVETKEPLDRMLRTSEASRMLDAHPKTVLRWMREGKLHCVNYSPRRIRIAESEVIRFMKTGQSVAEAAQEQ